MKKLVLALVMIFVVMVGRTQTFEGVIHWSMKMDITDPKIKAQMEEAKKKANDPANQAKVKEMQSKMNDPQMKAMMEQNPQMKAQMEAALKMIQGGDMNAMMPKGMTIKIKGKNALTSFEGGIMDKTEMLNLGDKNVIYAINNPAKTYTVVKPHETTQQRQPKITKTSETAKIAGYNCTKYLIEDNLDGKPSTISYWATTEVSGIDLKALAKQQAGRDQVLFPQIDGVPLKIESKTPEGVVTVECVDLKKESVPASTFVLPGGYTEAKI